MTSAARLFRARRHGLCNGEDGQQNDSERPAKQHRGYPLRLGILQSSLSLAPSATQPSCLPRSRGNRICRCGSGQMKFYEDGILYLRAASQLKRGRGNFNPVAIRRYYSQNSLQLTDVLFWAENVYRAEYTLTTSTRRLKCVSLVSVVLRDGQTLIERIKALNGC